MKLRVSGYVASCFDLGQLVKSHRVDLYVKGLLFDIDEGIYLKPASTDLSHKSQRKELWVVHLLFLDVDAYFSINPDNELPAQDVKHKVDLDFVVASYHKPGCFLEFFM